MMNSETPVGSNSVGSNVKSGASIIADARLIILILLTLALLAMACLSLRWRIAHDTPIMLYFGMLIDRFHFVPYRDIYDINMPGAYLLYILMGRVSGNNDFALRVIDLTLLILLIGLTCRIMRGFGRNVAWFASLLFGLLHLGVPNVFTLQREYILLLPLATITLLLVSHKVTEQLASHFYIGLLLGLIGTVKPHTMLAALPTIAIYLLVEFNANRERQTPFSAYPRSLMVMALGATIPLLIMVLYLIQSGSLPWFIGIVRNYWPLYGAMTGDFGVLAPGERPHYLLSNFLQAGGYRTLLPYIIVAIYLAVRHAGLDNFHLRRLWLIVGMALSYALYTLLAGAFWTYHWLPFLYFAMLLCGMLIHPYHTTGPLIPLNGITTDGITTDGITADGITADGITADGITPKGVSLVALTLCILLAIKFTRPSIFRAALASDTRVPKQGRVDLIADYLLHHSHPSDTVQALDYTGGANHAMLIAGLPTATPFVADFAFYHHISHPYIRTLRQRFIKQLQSSHPRWIIQVLSDDKPWPHGPDTTRSFEPLESLLQAEYMPRLQRADFILWERTDISQPPLNPAASEGR